MASAENAKELAKRIRTGKAKQVKADGLSGSSATLLLAAIMNGRGNCPNLLVVMNDLDDAGYVYHDLTQMMGEERVLFFPSSYKRAIKYNQKDAGNEILRTEVLTKVAEAQDLIVVTYPDALAERVVSKKELDENTLAVKVGEEFDISELEKRIFELGFERTDYVYEPGQFAIRGSIVDVYSFSSDMPYRIDFFGDEVDSIRSFDVQSQLSQGKVEMMTIVPEMKTDGTEYISFLEFLPKDTLVVTQSLAYVCDKVAQIHEEGFSSQAKTLSPTLPHNGEGDHADWNVDWENLVIDEETFRKQIVAFRHLELKQAKTNTPDGLPITGEMSEGQRGSTIHFHTSPQPLFHKNFDLVSQEFH